MKKSKMITIIAVIALVAIIAVTLVASTFARYATTAKATATVATAAWSFKAGLNTTETTTLNLYDTIANAATVYPNLTPKTIAPGTSGTFNVIIDGTGSGVGIDYTISFAKAAEGDTIPSGLTFNVNGTETAIGGNSKGTIALANVGTPVTVPVTWTWTLGDDEANDNYDKTAETGVNNTDAGKTITINVNVRGEQHIGTI